MKIIKALFGVLTITLIVMGCGKKHEAQPVAQQTTSVNETVKEFNFPNQDGQYPEKGIAVTSESSAESLSQHELELKSIYNSVDFLSEQRVLLKDSNDQNPKFGRVYRFRVSGFRATEEKKLSVAAENASTTVMGKQAELLGLFGPTALKMTRGNTTLSSRLAKLAAECDLRILDNAKNPAPIAGYDNKEIWPVAYLLFQTNSFNGARKIKPRELETFSPSIEVGFRAMDSDHEFGWICPIFCSGKKDFEPCDAVGWAIFGSAIVEPSIPNTMARPYSNPYGQGFVVMTLTGFRGYILITLGSPLHKWLMSAHYRTNIFVASQNPSELAKPFIGLWRAQRGFSDNPYFYALRIRENGTYVFMLRSEGQWGDASGTYVAGESGITLLKDGITYDNVSFSAGELILDKNIYNSPPLAPSKD